MSEEEQIFQLALSQPPEKRQAFLRQQCGEHESMIVRVGRLLEACAEPEFMSRPATDREPEFERMFLGEKAGDVIGPYELLLEIGSGGFGSVWMAVQSAPVRRTVALKILKLGMDTREVVARFEQERETLALMNHPNIARIYDAGVTPSGRPFIAMELVRGLPITRWCDDRRSTTQERLELFIQVCHAIQHAHQKGIIHRDLKPSNVLVTQESGPPLVKVIDFGVAKATQSLGLGLPLVTHIDQMIGTPIYMSPEQTGHPAQDVDTRSDIYALGVLLYELLTGTTPIGQTALAELGHDEVRRLIRESDPPRPSQRIRSLRPDRLETAALQHSAANDLFLHQMPGDLDWIVMKCLEKDRNRRYETADALALDLGRHLRDEPVLARPPSAFYVISKAFRRHRGLVSVAAGLLMLLLASAVAGTMLALRSKRAENAEATLRREADASRVVAEKHRNEALLHAYEADMGAAALLYRSHDIGQVASLLERHIPAPGLPDFRSFEWWFLNERIKGDQAAILRGHNNMVGALAFSRSGRLLASGDVGGGVRVWDVASGDTVATLPPSDSRIVGVSFSHDDSMLAAGDATRVTLYSVPGFTARSEIPLTLARPLFSPTEPILALGVNDNRWYGTQGEVQLWNWHDDPEGRAMRVLPGAGTRLDFTADGKTLLTGVTGERLQTWSVETASRTAAFPQATALGVAIAHNGSWAAAASSLLSPSPKIWNVPTGTELPPLIDKTKSAVSLAASPVDDRLAIGSSDQFITLWDVGRKTALRSLDGHRGEVTALAFSPDGQWLASGSMDETVRLWKLDGRQTPDRIGGIRTVLGMATVKVSPDGTLIAAATPGKLLKLWRSDAMTPHVTLGYARWPLGFSPDGSRIVTILPRGILEVWDTRTGRNLGGITLTLRPHQDCISSLSPDGSVAAICHAQQLSFVDVRGGRVLFQTTESRGMILGSAFSPDGKLLVTVSQDGRAIVHEVPDGRTRHVLNSHKQDVRAVAFSPDGQWLATGGHDTRIKIWDVASGREVADLPGQRQVVNFLAFTPDNRTLISAGDEDEVYFRRVGDWRILSRHRVPAPVRSLSLAASGSLLAIAGYPDALTVFRAPSPIAAAPPASTRWVLDEMPPASWSASGIPVRPPSLPPTCLDLARFYTARLQDSWASTVAGDDCSLLDFPQGEVILDGTRWDARGILQVYHREKDFPGAITAYPESVAGIPAGQPAKKIHLLAAATWAPPSRTTTEAGILRLHYADGASHDAPLVLGLDLLDWFANTPAELPPNFRSTIAWTGTNAAASRAGTSLRLFHVIVDNPSPTKPISTIDLHAVAGCPFLVAITVEP